MRVPNCPVEYRDAKTTWHRWEQRERGTTGETGEATLCLGWVPHVGTRRKFMEELFQAQCELWMPHVHRDRVRQFMCHKQVECMFSPEQFANPGVAISKADFATAVEVPRFFSAT